MKCNDSVVVEMFVSSSGVFTARSIEERNLVNNGQELGGGGENQENGTRINPRLDWFCPDSPSHSTFLCDN